MQHIYSGRRLSPNQRAAKLLRQRRPLLTAAAGLLLPVFLLLACDLSSGYQAVQHATQGRGITQTIQLPPFPTAVREHQPELPLLPVEIPPVPITTPIAGVNMNPCDGKDPFTSLIFENLGNLIKGFTRNVMLGGITMFNSALDTSTTFVEDNAVVWVSNVLASFAVDFWPLPILWMTLKKTGSIFTDGAEGSLATMFFRVGGFILLISPINNTSPLPISYLLGLPLLIVNMIMRFLIAVSTAGWSSMVAFVGIFGDGGCNGLGLLGLAALACIEGLLLAFASLLLLIRSGQLALCVAVSPLALLAMLFDETKNEGEELFGAYRRAMFGIIPAGVAFLLMNAYVFVPSGDMAQSASHLSLVVVLVLLMVMLLLRSLNPTTSLILSKLGRVGRQALPTNTQLMRGAGWGAQAVAGRWAVGEAGNFVGARVNRGSAIVQSGYNRAMDYGLGGGLGAGTMGAVNRLRPQPQVARPAPPPIIVLPPNYYSPTAPTQVMPTPSPTNPLPGNTTPLSAPPTATTEMQTGNSQHKE